MIIELLLILSLNCIFPEDRDEAYRESCNEIIFDTWLKTPRSPYEALYIIDQLEREMYERNQACADLIDQLEEDYKNNK